MMGEAGAPGGNPYKRENTQTRSQTQDLLMLTNCASS